MECHCLFIPIRNPQQQFCSRVACQNTRKHHWRKQKRKNDPDYRENQNRSSQAWRQKNPHYWHCYRTTHPGYADSNRQRQRVYKQNLSVTAGKSQELQFANSDALALKNAINTGTYKLIPHTHPGFANSDALTVKISIITEAYSNLPPTSLVCK
jgi:hypothetical protein